MLKLFSAVLLFALTGLPLTILAAAPPAGTATHAVSAPQTGVRDEPLRHFVAAYQAVSKIRRQLMIETHGMKDQDKIVTLQKQAETQMKAAILEYLTLGEYVRIGKAVNTNPKLHSRFMAMREAADLPPAPATH